jgi:hypothetical protein
VLQDSAVDRCSRMSRRSGLHAHDRPRTADASTRRRIARLRLRVDAFRKQCLLNGWDDIGLTLRSTDEIRAFEAIAAPGWREQRRGC